jgi:DNA-directed RNA polymerase subunit F
MDRETLEHLLALREVNKALIDGLKAAVYYLDKVDQISEEQRKSMIESLNGLIAQSEAVYGGEPTRQ